VYSAIGVRAPPTIYVSLLMVWSPVLLVRARPI
jgi:hypothetical protein